LLSGISLFAEFFANDKPVLIRYQNALFFPVFIDYAETTFGGDFETSADYHDPYLQQLINQDGWLLWPLIPFRYNTHISDLAGPAPTAPDKRTWLGTDDQARDVLARVIYGFRISVAFALLLTIGCSVIGIIAGAIQGYFGGWIDLAGQRFLEVWSG